MSFRVYFSIYSGWSNGYRIIKLITGYCSSRHILCSSTLSLRSLNGGSICNYGWICPLIPTIHGLYTEWYLSENPLHNYICRSKHNILSSTLPRPIRYASTLLRLSRCLHNMKHSIFHRLIHLTNSSNINDLHNLRSLRIQTRSTNSTTHFNKHWMITRVSSTISHLWGANLCTIEIRKEGIEPPKIGFKPMS